MKSAIAKASPGVTSTLKWQQYEQPGPQAIVWPDCAKRLAKSLSKYELQD